MIIFYNEKCIKCGKFIKLWEKGASWAQSWSYTMDGTPDLHDPRWQCAKCTIKYGKLETNCAHPERYSGINL